MERQSDFNDTNPADEQTTISLTDSYSENTTPTTSTSPGNEEQRIEVSKRTEEVQVVNGEDSYDSESDDSVTQKARESGRALRALVDSLIAKTKETTIEQTERLKQAANDERPVFVEDAASIQRLGEHVDKIISNFDDTMDTIGREPYATQEGMLVGYKKVLQEEINVINARLNLARRMPVTHEEDALVPPSDANEKVEVQRNSDTI